MNPRRRSSVNHLWANLWQFFGGETPAPVSQREKLVKKTRNRQLTTEQLESRQLLAVYDAFAVSSNGNTATSPRILEKNSQYSVNVSGFVLIQKQQSRAADAEYFETWDTVNKRKTGNWADVSTYSGVDLGVRLSQVSGAGKWGAMNGSGSYTQTVTGTGKQLKAKFADQPYSDNAGSFQITVYQNIPVSVSAYDAMAKEQGQDPGTFRITRGGGTRYALPVKFSLSSTSSDGAADYNSSATSSVTIPAGKSYVDVKITPVDDSSYETDEAVTLTLQSDSKYDLASGSTSATVEIEDNDGSYISVAATDAAEEGPVSGGFTVTRSGNLSQAQTIDVTLTGSSSDGAADYYATYNGTTYYHGDTISITFPAETSSSVTEQPIDIAVTPIDDSDPEVDEVVDMALSLPEGYELVSGYDLEVKIEGNDLALDFDHRDWVIYNNDDDDLDEVLDYSDSNGVLNDDDLEPVTLTPLLDSGVDPYLYSVSITTVGLSLWLDAGKSIPLGSNYSLNSLPTSFYVEAISNIPTGSFAFTVTHTILPFIPLVFTQMMDVKDLTLQVNGGDVDDTSPVSLEMIGENQSVKLANLGDYKSIKWSVPGQIFKKYEVAADSSTAKVIKVTEEELGEKELEFRWLEGDLNRVVRKVSVDITLADEKKGDKTTTRAARFGVKVPTDTQGKLANITKVTKGKGQFVDQFPLDLAKDVYYLELTQDPTKPSAKGIVFERSTVAGGEYQWVQTADITLKGRNSASQVMDINSLGEGLDSTYPYGGIGAEAVNDSPAIHVYSDPPVNPGAANEKEKNKFDAVMYDGKFRMVLMWRSTEAGSDWVPLSEVKWTWSSKALWEGPSFKDWKIKDDKPDAPAAGSPTQEFPVWSKIVRVPGQD